MNQLFTMAIVSLVAGVVMLVFSQTIGLAFCRLGKVVFAVFKPIPSIWNIVNTIYDQEMAPGRFKFLGAVLVAQAVVMAVMGLFMHV